MTQTTEHRSTGRTTADGASAGLWGSAPDRLALVVVALVLLVGVGASAGLVLALTGSTVGQVQADTGVPAGPAPEDSPVVADPLPLTAAHFFTDPVPTIDGTGYTRLAIRPMTCAQAASGKLAAVLTQRGCRSTLVASYVDSRRTRVVTVGIVEMPDEAATAAAVDAMDDGGAFAMLPAPSSERLATGRTTYDLSSGAGHYVVFSRVTRADGGEIRSEDPDTTRAGADLRRLATAHIEAAQRAR